MIIKVAEYKIRKEALETVIKAIERFVRAIREHEPNTFYQAFRRNDSLEFVHLMKFPDEHLERKHSKAQYTTEFVNVLYPSCEKQPLFTDLTALESV